MAPMVRIASTVEEFETQIFEALEFDYDPVIVDRRQAFARENTWAARVASLIERLFEAFARVTVVGVDALEPQQKARPEYPNVEFASVGMTGAEALEAMGEQGRSDVLILTNTPDRWTARGEIARGIAALRQSHALMLDYPDQSSIVLETDLLHSAGRLDRQADIFTAVRSLTSNVR